MLTWRIRSARRVYNLLLIIGARAARSQKPVKRGKERKKEKLDERKRSTRVQIGALALIRRIHPSFFMLGGLECSPCSSLAITRGWYLICTPVSCVDRIRRSDSPADKFINSVEQSPWQETNPPKEIRPSSLRRYFDSRTRSWVTDNHARRDHFLYYPWQIWWETLSRVVRYNRVESFDGVPGAMCFVRGQIVTVLSEGCNRMWNNLYSIQRVCKSSLTLKESKSA